MKQVSGRPPLSLSETTCSIFINKNAIRIYVSFEILATAIQKIINNLLPSLYFMHIQAFSNADPGKWLLLKLTPIVTPAMPYK